MITKRDFLIIVMVIIMLAIGLGILIDRMWQESNLPPSANTQVSINASYIENWTLGDPIVPFPYIDGKKLDCDDAVLYSYLWLEDMPNLKVNIMYGILGFYEDGTWIRRGHVWLVVSDNQSSRIYDYGIALPADFFKGRKISYAQLLMYANQDQ